jgi:hypothetical protein
MIQDHPERTADPSTTGIRRDASSIENAMGLMTQAGFAD